MTTSVEYYSMRTKMKPLLIDLFSGCGGLSCGFAQAGFEVVAGLDKNEQALSTFNRNFPAAEAIHADLSEYDPGFLVRKFRLGRGILDCLIGGPPCQGFSKNVPASQRFLEDPRNRLMKLFLEYVERLMPKVVLIENVAEVLNAYDGAVKAEIMQCLGDLGYEIDADTLNSAWYGVPQLRRRAFFLASRTRKRASLPAPTHAGNVAKSKLSLLLAPAVTVWDAIGDLPELEAGEGTDPCSYARNPFSEFQRRVRNGSKVHDHTARKLTPIQLKRIQHLGPGEGIKHLPKEIRPAQGYSGAYARLILDQPARTITRWVFHPGSGRFIHPQDDRMITIREAARLQSFPDRFVFTGTYIQKSHQVGEAVPPLLAMRIANQVKEALGVS